MSNDTKKGNYLVGTLLLDFYTVVECLICSYDVESSVPEVQGISLIKVDIVCPANLWEEEWMLHRVCLKLQTIQ